MFIKDISKYVAVVVIAILVFYLGAEAGFQAKYRLDQWKTARRMDQFNKMVEELFKNDTYGGETPEETYSLFVTALKNEDVDLAVKYIILDAERQRKYYDEFSDKKQNGTLEKYVESLPEWEEFKQVKDEYNDWVSQAEVWYSTTIDEPMMIYDEVLRQEIEVPPGTYVQQDITFTKNINNLWKISSF